MKGLDLDQAWNEFLSQGPAWDKVAEKYMVYAIGAIAFEMLSMSTESLTTFTEEVAASKDKPLSPLARVAVIKKYLPNQVNSQTPPRMDPHPRAGGPYPCLRWHECTQCCTVSCFKMSSKSLSTLLAPENCVSDVLPKYVRGRTMKIPCCTSFRYVGGGDALLESTTLPDCTTLPD